MGVENAEKVALWSQRMAAFEASGQPRRAWCKAQGLSLGTFGYWRRRLCDRAGATGVVAAELKQSCGLGKRPTMTAGLVPVVVRGVPLSASASVVASVELAWPNGLRLTTTLGIVELGTLVRSLSPC